MFANGVKLVKPRKRHKVKGRKSSGPFIRMPRDVLDSSQFGALSPQAIKLLMELARQYRGNNNGDLSAAWSQLKLRGWRSPGTLARAKRELVDSGFVTLTRQGGRHRCSLYAVTWEAIDDCNGKHDERPTAVPLKLWQKKSLALVHRRTNVDLASTDASLANPELDPMRTSQGTNQCAF